MSNNHFANIGYGTYRIEYKSDDDFIPLKKALVGGINLIDTSTNYSDGGSEILIGNTISELISEGKINREDIIIVTKVGYLQGQNFRMAMNRKNAGQPFSEVCEYTDDLWHCISPDFIEDQLERQLERLYPGRGENYIDIYLLHNPEYFLGWALNTPKVESPEEVYNEYYRRIKKAFEYLEEKVNKKVIRAYGISSNTFPSPSAKYDFTSLERIINLSKEVVWYNNFKCIQMPMNLIESGALLEKNQKNNTESVIDLAIKNKIGILINRPLNAITNQGLLRLTKYSHTYIGEEEIIKQLEYSTQLEKEIKSGFDSSVSINTFNLFTLSEQLKENWKRIYSIEHLKEIAGHYFSPRIKAIQSKFPDNRQLAEYISEIQKSINYVTSHFIKTANDKIKLLENIIDEESDDMFRQLPFSSKAISVIANVKGINFVLVGARREKYVDQILELSEKKYYVNAERILTRIQDEVSSIKPSGI